MEIIKVVSGKIDDELDDAISYAKLALEYKDKKRNVADTFYTLAQEEFRHNQMLHDTVVNIIEEYRRANGDPPSNMQAVYDYLHQKAIEKAEQAKRYLSMYKE